MNLSDNNAVIDRLLFFIDKTYCSMQFAIKDGYSMHCDIWNLTYNDVREESPRVWRMHSPIRNLPVGNPARRTTPFSHMLIGRKTSTTTVLHDIDRLFGLPKGVMSSITGGFRSTPRSIKYSKLDDLSYGTKIFSWSHYIGAHMMNCMFRMNFATNIPAQLVQRIDELFGGVVYV